jgi:hypothetical protein
MPLAVNVEKILSALTPDELVKDRIKALASSVEFLGVTRSMVSI